MATKNSLILNSGFIQELNTSSDKLNLAGNSTSDLSEGTNQYFTNARARGAISVTDSGGDGSLAYNSSTGVITYTGQVLVKYVLILVLRLDQDLRITMGQENSVQVQYQIAS